MLYEKRADEDGHLLFTKRDAEHVTPYDPMPHFHSSVEFYICVSGKHTVYINGETYTLHSGEIAFVDRFSPHTSGTPEGEEPATVYTIVASSTYLEGIKWLGQETLPAFTKKHAGYDKIEELVIWAYGMKKKMNEEMKLGFVTLLLGMMHDYCGSTSRVGDKNTKLLVNVMRYIDDNYSSKITLESLAKEFGYEKTYLSRLFNKFLGMNLREYLNRRRIIALKKLRRTDKDMPIWKAAEACGFDSPNTYYRAIEKYGSE